MAFARAAGVLLAIALTAGPALAETPAQNAPADGSGTAPDASPGTGIGTAGPGLSQPGAAVARGDAGDANPALTRTGEVRASKVIGAAVYNDRDQKVGTLDDILLGTNRKAEQAVISVGGVLGVGAKLVAVPFGALRFPAQVGGSTARVMLPGATTDTLNGRPAFRYAGG